MFSHFQYLDLPFINEKINITAVQRQAPATVQVLEKQDIVASR